MVQEYLFEVYIIEESLQKTLKAKIKKKNCRYRKIFRVPRIILQYRIKFLALTVFLTRTLQLSHWKGRC